MEELHDNKKIHFDLNLLEFALSKTIEICNLESEILSSKIKIDVEDLDKIYQEKEDLMNFIDWHIPLIVRYIKMHKNDLDDADDIKNLAIRAMAMNATAYNALKTSTQLPIQSSEVIGNDKVSTITIMHAENDIQKVLEVFFINDSDDMVKIISKLLKEMISALEVNFNKISARKHLNDQILILMSDALTFAKKQKESYNPKRKKDTVHSCNDEYVIYNQDC